MSERDMQRLLALVEKHLGSEWTGAIDWLRNLDSNSIDEIERRLYAGDIAGVVQAVDQAALRFAAEAHASYLRAADASAKWLDDQPALADKLIRFDAADPYVVQRARQNQLELVQGLREESRQTIRNVIVDGQRDGLNPRTIARDIHQSIGLTPTQEQHVRNYRRQLESGDWSGALSRELSSGHTDRVVRTAQRDSSQLTEQQIETAVERYRQNYIGYRAEVIARTESARNVHEGVQDAMKQAVSRGDIDADSLVKEWIPGPRTKDARPTHHSSALASQRPRFDKPFDVGGVRMMHPGDDSLGAGADDLANCRCTYATTLEA